MAVATLFNQLGLDVVDEELEGLGVVLADDLPHKELFVLHEDEACDEREIPHELRERVHRDHVFLLFPRRALMCNVLLHHQHNLLFVVGNLEAEQLEALDAQWLALVLRPDVISGLELARPLLKILIVIVLRGIRLTHIGLRRDFQVLVDGPTDAGVSPATVREGVLPH